jgi:YD repeat-containing protein
MAKDYGIEAYGARLDYKKLNMIKKPVIIYIKNKNHFIVLKELNGKKAKIIDPFNGEKEEEIENIRKLWEGEAIIFTKIEKKYLLTEKEMNEYKGGCCGKALPPPCLGNDCETCPAELPSVSPVGSSKGCATGNCGGFNRGKNGSIGANPKISVSPRSLNLIVEETPIGYNSQIGPSIYIKLTYNTDDSDTGFFGNGWSSILDIRLYEQPDQSIIIKRSSGNQTIYVYSDGNYISPAGIYHTLIKNSDGTFTLKEKSGTKYYFGTNQRIKKIEDRNGNFITFNYDSYDRPIEIIDSVGRKTTITYNSNNLVSQIEDPIGRSAYFSYDEADNLISITDIGGYSCSFTYDSNNNINSITTPLGTTNIIYQNPYLQMYRIKIITPNGKTTDYFWDGSGFTSGANIITTAAGKQTWYFVNWEGLVDTILEAITQLKFQTSNPPGFLFQKVITLI